MDQIKRTRHIDEINGSSSIIFPVLHLDLYNFSSPEAEESNYVLTSPRSLESCAKLGVKPVDLLCKSLTEFIEENQGSSLEAVTELYEEYERGRRERVRMCREEREKLIQEDRTSSLKPFTGLETVPKSQSIQESKEADPDGFPEGKTTCCQKLPSSFGLRCSPGTETRIKRLSQEISRKLGITVPGKDLKLAALMLAKHDQEELSSRRRKLEEQHREDERSREEVRSVHSEEKRRKQLLERIHRWQEDLEARRRRREEQERMLVEHRGWETLQQEERWRKLAEEQQVRRRTKQEEASKEAEARKQERLLKERWRGEEAHREKELRTACEKEQQAARRKQIQEKTARRRLEIRNQEELLKHVSVKKELEEQRLEEEEQRREELEMKLRRSEENRVLLVKARMQEVRGRAAREDELMRRARLRAGTEDAVRTERRRMLEQRCRLRTDHAVIRTLEKLGHRARSARQENRAKEITHQRLREKVLEEEKAQWERRCRTVADKDERREKLQKEREEDRERRRRVALASCYMREMVRELTSRRTFDLMAREAEMTSHLLERLNLNVKQ